MEIQAMVTGTDDRASSFPAGLCCPACLVTIACGGEGCRCVACSRPVLLLGGRVPDCLGGAGAGVEAIAAWSNEALARALLSLIALRSDGNLASEQATVLESMELSRSGLLTGLGECLAYHLSESERQREDGRAGALLGFLAKLGVGPASRIIDIGGGAGQTLQLLAGLEPAERVCLDVNAESLVFGARWAELESQSIQFVRASAHELPFAAGRFSHVICRVGLNYMHQARALSEMARVLEPGGGIYVRVEGPGLDVQLIRKARSARELASRLIDFSAGLALGLSGRQAMPGGPLRGGRLFGTAQGVGRSLRRAHCSVVGVVPTRGSLGLTMGFDLLARRDLLPQGGATRLGA